MRLKSYLRISFKIFYIQKMYLFWEWGIYDTKSIDLHEYYTGCLISCGRFFLNLICDDNEYKSNSNLHISYNLTCTFISYILFGLNHWIYKKNKQIGKCVKWAHHQYIIYFRQKSFTPYFSYIVTIKTIFLKTNYIFWKPVKFSIILYN